MSISRRSLSLALISFIISACSTAAQTIYVDPNATGPTHDGLSWCSALIELHQALALDPPATEIHIADGTYLPDPGALADPRLATFRLESTVIIKGGYAGCGAVDPDAWDPLLYPTVLSGDLAGDDYLDSGAPLRHTWPDNLLDNVYRVIYASGPETYIYITGVTICGGNGGSIYSGGGIYNNGAQLTLSTSVLERNIGLQGGGASSEAGWLSFIQCYIQHNRAIAWGGGLSTWSTEVSIANCLFFDNQALSDGGAIYSDLSNVYLYNTTFADNSSAGRGGALYNYVGVGLNLQNSILWQNTDMNGGGESAQIYNNPSNYVEINHCSVEGWTGTYGGTGNIGDDPLFANPQAANFSLSANSPCRDTGDNGAVYAQFDLAGQPRVVNNVVDMGAYEYQGSSSVGPDYNHSELRAQLLPISPNPIRHSGHIRFIAPMRESISIRIFDLCGRLVRDLGSGPARRGINSIEWNGRDEKGHQVPTGIYLVNLTPEGSSADYERIIYLR